MLLITPYNTPIYCNCHVNRYPIVFSHRTLENDTVERIETIVGSLNVMLQLRLFLHHLNEDQTSKFRKWEVINKKIINATKANIFNHNCIREHLCPKCNYLLLNVMIMKVTCNFDHWCRVAYCMKHWIWSSL